MDKQSREVVLSQEIRLDLNIIFEYGKDTFGLRAAQSFMADVIFKLESLSTLYELYSECRFLPTKSNMYRNLFLGSYIIIYRIRPERIEVLRAFHSSQSIRKLKTSRKVKPV